MAGVIGRKEQADGLLFATDGEELADGLELILTVTDRETIDELSSYGEGRARIRLRCRHCGSAFWPCGRPADESTPT